MSRGGPREGAGGKPTWKHGKTKTIRVPIALADQILNIAKQMDEGKIFESDDDSKIFHAEIEQFAEKWKQLNEEAIRKSPRTGRWDKARKMLEELESLLYKD